MLLSHFSGPQKSTLRYSNTKLWEVTKEQCRWRCKPVKNIRNSYVNVSNMTQLWCREDNVQWNTISTTLSADFFWRMGWNVLLKAQMLLSSDISDKILLISVKSAKMVRFGLSTAIICFVDVASRWFIWREIQEDMSYILGFGYGYWTASYSAEHSSAISPQHSPIMQITWYGSSPMADWWVCKWTQKP